MAGLLGCSATLFVCWVQCWSRAGSLLRTTTIVCHSGGRGSCGKWV